MVLDLHSAAAVINGAFRPAEVIRAVTTDTGRLASERGRRQTRDRRDGKKRDSDDANDANVTVSLDELTDLDVEREVRQLKTQQASGREERSVTGGATTAREQQDDGSSVAADRRSRREPPYRKH